MAGRPRSTEDAETLQHHFWTRDRVRGTITLSRYPRAQQRRHVEMLARLRGVFLDAEAPAPDLPEYLAARLLELWAEGWQPESIAQHIGRGAATVKRWLRMHAKRTFLAAYLAGAMPDELSTLGLRLRLGKSRRYELQDLFVFYVSAQLARESYQEHIDAARPGGDGRTPPPSKLSDLRVKLSPDRTLLSAFDRYGRLRLAPEQLAGGRESGTSPAADQLGAEPEEEPEAVAV